MLAASSVAEFLSELSSFWISAKACSSSACVGGWGEVGGSGLGLIGVVGNCSEAAVSGVGTGERVGSEVGVEAVSSVSSGSNVGSGVGVGRGVMGSSVGSVTGSGAGELAADPGGLGRGLLFGEVMGLASISSSVFGWDSGAGVGAETGDSSRPTPSSVSLAAISSASLSRRLVAFW